MSKDIFEKIDRKAEAGLCQTTFGGAREFLKGIRRDCAEAVADIPEAPLGVPFDQKAVILDALDATAASERARLALRATVDNMASQARGSAATPPASGRETHTGPDGYQRVTQRPDWMECERVSNIPTVHETIQAFADDPTADNATGMVQAIIEANQKAPIK